MRSDVPLPVRVEHAVAQALIAAAGVDDACARVLVTLGERQEWTLGFVWVDKGDALHCEALWQEPDVDVHELVAQARSTPRAAGAGPAGRAWAAGTPQWAADLTVEPDLPWAAVATEAGLRAAYSVPIRSVSGTHGAFELFTTRAVEPDAERAETLMTVGAQLGQLIETRRAQDAVTAAGELTRAMLDASLDCIVQMDHEGRILEFNPAAERTFGYRADEAVGSLMADLIVPPALRDRHRAGLQRYLAGGDAVILDRRIEVLGMRRDGNEFPVELTITCIDLSGPARFTGYLRDITEQKRAADELRASRARVVEAADAERRRLERDLHDGAQQRLVSLGLALRLGRARIAEDPAAAGRLLDEAIADLEAAAAELRELAHGIHPAVLTEGGLAPALRVLTARARDIAAVRLLSSPAARYPAAVEAAVYFLVAEALTNASRHAGAANVEVRVDHAGDRLELEVRDDGKGGADPAAGSGLRGLADRVTALGGTFAVDSPVDGGTTLRAALPATATVAAEVRVGGR